MKKKILIILFLSVVGIMEGAACLDCFISAHSVSDADYARMAQELVNSKA